MTPTVLDASALLAYLGGENGAERVTRAITEGAVIHAVNWAEVLSKQAERGHDPRELAESLTEQGLVGQLLTVDAGELLDAVAVAELRPLARSAGLSLGDRYCLALGQRLRGTVLTTDRAWAALPTLPGLTIEVIR